MADLINDGKAYLPSSSSSSTARKVLASRRSFTKRTLTTVLHLSVQLVLPGNYSYREFTVSMTPILKKDFMITLATSNREVRPAHSRPGRLFCADSRILFLTARPRESTSTPGDLQVCSASSTATQDGLPRPSSRHLFSDPRVFLSSDQSNGRLGSRSHSSSLQGVVGE